MKELRSISVIETPVFNQDDLGTDQRVAFDAILPRLLSRSTPAVRAIIYGSAGSGKSTLVHALRSQLSRTCRVCEVTGYAAAPVYGDTIHSLLHIPPCGLSATMTIANRTRLQAELADVNCFLIDDYSMYVT